MLELLIRLNNWITRKRGGRVNRDQILLLLPHCLQNSSCQHNIMNDLNNCRRCGKCDIAELLKLRDKYGIRCAVVGGGRQALACVKDKGIKAVVAVACAKELLDGIRASLPKRVLAVCNTRPHGPCKDTSVNPALVESAIMELLDPDPATGNQA